MVILEKPKTSWKDVGGLKTQINEIKEGTFILPKRVSIEIGDRQIEIPSTLVMPVGKGEPPIQIR